jgi:hypothetical protein
MNQYEQLTWENLRYLHSHLKDFGYLIIDEKSMIVLRIIYWL